MGSCILVVDMPWWCSSVVVGGDCTVPHVAHLSSFIWPFSSCFWTFVTLGLSSSVWTSHIVPVHFSFEFPPSVYLLIPFLSFSFSRFSICFSKFFIFISCFSMIFFMNSSWFACVMVEGVISPVFSVWAWVISLGMFFCCLLFPKIGWLHSVWVSACFATVRYVLYVGRRLPVAGGYFCTTVNSSCFVASVVMRLSNHFPLCFVHFVLFCSLEAYLEEYTHVFPVPPSQKICKFTV